MASNKTLTVQQRLAIVVAVPLVFLSVVLTKESYDHYTNLRQASHSLQVAGIATGAARIAHQLQDERSLTDAFLVSNGQRVGSELAGQRRETDRMADAFRKFIADTRDEQGIPALTAQVQQTLNALDRLTDLRRRVDALAIGGGDAFVAYGEILAESRATVRLVSQVIPNQELMRLIACHYNFLEYLMRLHGERLLMINTFTNNEFALLAFMRFAEGLAEQKVYLESFQTLSTQELRDFYVEKLKAPQIRQVTDLRQIAIDHRFGGGFNVDPNRWREAINGMINLMNDVETRLVHDYLEAGQQYLSDTRIALFTKLGIGFLIWWCTAIAAVIVAIGLIRLMGGISSEVNDGTIQVTSASHQLAATSQAVAESSSRQAAAIEETSASVEEMSAMINRDADNALQADALMREANQVLTHADESMKKLVISMNEIDAASMETQKIVKTIDEIAFQTNLLALNAAVEAARAGEAGAGFAVVADEVRNLAMRAAEAAKNTSTLIEGTVHKVHGGTSLVTEAGESFTSARTAVEKIAILLAEITTAAREEAVAINQVNQSIAHIDQATQDNAASAQETAAAAEELSSQAEAIQLRVAELLALVGRSAVKGLSRQAQLSSGKPSAPSASRLPRSTPAKPKAAALPKMGQLAKTTGGGKTASRPQPAAAPTKSKASEIIPMDDENFEDF